MKSFFLKYLLSVFTLFLAVSAHGAEGNLVIMTPPDRSALDSQLISLVVKVDKDSVDVLEIIVNGKKQARPGITIERGYVCLDGVQLSPGINRIKVGALKNGVRTGEINITVFSRSELSVAGNTVPSGFKRYYFHSGSNEKACAGCHLLDFKGMKENPASTDKSPCYTCHKKVLASNQFAHGPASVWSCSLCHEVKQENRNKSRLEADNRNCVACHADSMDSWKSMKNMHGPTAAGECTTCHNPHASDQRYFLRKHAADLCLSCHEEIATKPHVVSGFSGNGHPLRLRSDPLRPGREFSCVSCHNPHASNSLYFLNFNKSSGSDLVEFCKACHSF